ncbi:alkaline phosphatase family protein [Streptacidiphilus monticola]|uniref:Alkaline phosphatase family protein n=1 Tax=Streptacidiphilus monticola TaxID=2161674 RepID=A0ABW1FV23_9ACTN
MLPEVVARSLRAAGRGVIVLALDGLSHEVAAETLRHAHLRPLRSTFPSTSTTAWLTSVTGVPASEHGAVGMVYRSPGAASVTHLVTGRSIGFGDSQAADPATELVVPRATVFDLATAAGRPAHVLGAELERLSGAWVEALLHGARLLPSAADGLRTDPVEVAERSVRDVDAALVQVCHRATAPGLLWVYVNLDEHIHRHGHDGRLRRALALLDAAGDRWAEAGWTALAYADHGQSPVAPREQLQDAWRDLDSPAWCRMPAGGAGRVRWMHPRPGRRDELAERLADTLGRHALVLSPADLEARGLLTATDTVLDRIGEVVAVATSPSFPVPDPSLSFEHGACSAEETTVPLAGWGSALTTAVP